MLIHGEKVRLRVVTQADLALFDAWNDDPQFQSEYNTFGLQPSGLAEQSFAKNGMLSPQHGRLLIIISNNVVIGYVSYHQEKYGPGEGSIAYNIGIGIISEHRSKGYGSEAQLLLTNYLFSTYPIMRVEASTDITNIPEQRALEKIGFTREGVLRKAQWRNGQWHDLVLYSKLRGE